MTSPDNNDPLDDLLRTQAYVEDNGFTARVVSALPRSPRRPWLRPALLLSATAIGYVLAIFWLPWESISTALASHPLNSQTLLSVAVALAITASLWWGIFAAVGSEDF